jgi:hypothetical protein
MDFAIWECSGGTCSADVATSATHITAGVNVNLTIDFGAITTGPSLVFNTPLGTALSQIMNQGMNNLSASPKLPDLPWFATVTALLTGPNALIDMGSNNRLGTNQTFTVYSTVPDTSSSCPAYKPMAYVHTTEVDSVSSYIQTDTTLDPAGVQVGDRVMVRAAQ